MLKIKTCDCQYKLLIHRIVRLNGSVQTSYIDMKAYCIYNDETLKYSYINKALSRSRYTKNNYTLKIISILVNKVILPFYALQAWFFSF